MEFDNTKPPNKYTIAMGELIRKAREEAGLSQEQLAEKTYRKRLAVYEMEAGKVEISAWTIPLLADALNKPLIYFYPQFLIHKLTPEDLSPLEQELILQFRLIWNDDLQKLAIRQVKSIAEFDPEQTILDSLKSLEFNLENQAKFREILEKRPRYEKIFSSIMDLIEKLKIK